MVANYRPLRAPVYFTCLAQSSDPDLGTVTGSGKYLVGETVTLTAMDLDEEDREEIIKMKQEGISA